MLGLTFDLIRFKGSFDKFPTNLALENLEMLIADIKHPQAVSPSPSSYSSLVYVLSFVKCEDFGYNV